MIVVFVSSLYVLDSRFFMGGNLSLFKFVCVVSSLNISSLEITLNLLLLNYEYAIEVLIVSWSLHSKTVNITSE